MVLEIDETILTMLYENAKNNHEYKDHLYKAIELGRKIMQHLGPNNSIFLEYENSIIQSNGLLVEKAYELGREHNDH